MSIQVKCDACGRSFKVKDQYAGQSGLCPYCAASISVPELIPEEAEVVIAYSEKIEINYSSIPMGEQVPTQSSLSLVTRVPKAPCPECDRPNLVGNPSCFYCGAPLI